MEAKFQLSDWERVYVHERSNLDDQSKCYIVSCKLLVRDNDDGAEVERATNTNTNNKSEVERLSPFPILYERLS